jgi:hypothetical protein
MSGRRVAVAAAAVVLLVGAVGAYHAYERQAGG